MTLLSKILALLGLRPAASGAKVPAPGGALSAPPELTSQSEEGFQDLVLFIDHVELLPLGSQVIRASALHQGRRVALEVVLGPDWREGTFADKPCYQGLVTYRSVGPESDALLRILDRLYETKAAPPAMAGLTDFACLTLGGDPRDLRAASVKAKLFLEPEDEGSEGSAELYMNVDLAARRLEIREKDPEYRAAIVRALAARP